MKLPDGEHAFIAPEMLIEYLLSEDHPYGGSRALFLISNGFDPTNPAPLAEALLRIAALEEIVSSGTTEHGTKYVLDGTMGSPTGRTISLRTVWMIQGEETRPRFVTAYPRGNRG